MCRTSILIGFAIAVLFSMGHESHARGGRGGGGGGGGIGGGGGSRGGAVAGSYSGGGGAARSSASVVGPAGGSRSAATGSGSYTTNRGSTINYAGAGRGGTTPGGVNYGKGVGGVQVTTPGGKTASHVGAAGGASGPGGNAVGGRTGASVVTGANGSFGTAYRGGVAIGPQGGAAASSRVGAAKGPGGSVARGARGAAAVGGYGAAAAGSRAVAGRTNNGTFYASRTALATTGGSVRGGFGYYNTFNPGWYARYPGAWFVAGWTTARIWSAPAWGSVATYCSYPEEPLYYDYGENVVYGENTVNIGGQEVPVEQYDQHAASIAAMGKDAQVEPNADDFQPLGVFAMVQAGEEKSTNIFQLAVSRGGIIRGNYYNALTDTDEPVYGSVEKQTQKAAWTVGDRKSPVYETGIANFTKDESTMLVHFSTGNAQQFMLIRIQQPESQGSPDGN